MAITAAELCNIVQTSLQQVATENDLAMRRTPTGVASALNSSENKAGFSEPVFNTLPDGKTQKAVIGYWKKGCESTDEVESVCESGSAVNMTYIEKSISQYRATPVLLFTDAQMRTICGSSAAYRANALATYIDKMFRDMNADLATLAIAAAGNHYDGVTGTVNVPMLYWDGLNEAAKPQGQVDVRENFENLGYMGRPILVGNGYLSRYMKYQDIGCCNDYGQIIGESDPFAFYRDLDYGTAASNANAFLAFAPGAMQLLVAPKFVGEFAINAPQRARMSIVDPYTGLPIDMDVSQDCDMNWRVKYSINFDLFATPDDVNECEGDGGEGTNGIFKYVATRTAES